MPLIGPLPVDNTSISNCVGGIGAAIYTSGTSLIENSFIFSNTATDRGGAIGGIANSGTTITNTSLHDNRANWGGAIYISGGSLDMLGGDITNNTAVLKGGGGIFCQGTISVTGVNFLGNSAGTSGGAILVNLVSTLTLKDCNFDSNECNTQGGNGVGPNLAYVGTLGTTVTITQTDCTGLNQNEPAKAG